MAAYSFWTPPRFDVILLAYFSGPMIAIYHEFQPFAAPLMRCRWRWPASKRESLYLGDFK